MKSRRVVVSGVPGSGKSTLGREVASRLNLAFLDKDDFLDALFDSEPITETRSALSRRADEQFIGEALATEDAVVVSFWRRPELSQGSGTPAAWLEQSDDLVELFCDCPPLVSVRRFEARRRHVRHDDETRSTKDLLDQFTALAALGPIGLGSLVRVDTAGHVDVDAVTAAIEVKLPDIRARYSDWAATPTATVRPKPSTAYSRRIRPIQCASGVTRDDATVERAPGVRSSDLGSHRGSQTA